MNISAPLKAPFPWFGGKSRVSHLVWQHFGDVPNFVEPFAGSLAVLLQRPHQAKTETVNDADCYLSNFWRALSLDPEGVAHHADWPVNEIDLLARHKWLIAQDEFRARMVADPDFYDIKVAGWWVWGLCSWIGSGWCHTESAQLPHLGDAGRGRLPSLRGDSGATGQGIHASAFEGKTGGIHGYFLQLHERLRKVRIACGDWSRVMGDSVTHKHGITGVFLDPPYASDRNQAYAVDSKDVAHEVREWAIANGDNPLLRIALCGYEGEHAMPAGWEAIAWKAQGGFGSQAKEGKGRDNAAKERIWFSPHCLYERGLFAALETPQCSLKTYTAGLIGWTRERGVPRYDHPQNRPAEGVHAIPGPRRNRGRAPLGAREKQAGAAHDAVRGLHLRPDRHLQARIVEPGNDGARRPDAGPDQCDDCGGVDMKCNNRSFLPPIVNQDRSSPDEQCTAPGCTRKRTGVKFCRPCAEISKQASLTAGKIRYLAKLKAQRAAKKKANEAKPKTKLCPSCKAVEIPLKRHYCDGCRDESIRAKKRESQKRLRQREKTGPIHCGFAKSKKPLSDEDRDRIDAEKRQEDRAEESRLALVRYGLNSELLMTRVMRGAMMPAHGVLVGL